MFNERHVIIDNRVFLLGLESLYREAMKRHERGELLTCARHVAGVLHAAPAGVPVEGYYVEDEQLTEYFRLVRALQDVDESAAPSVGSLPEFRRLFEVLSAPLYGRPQYTGKLLPTGRDALSQALGVKFPEWTVASVTAAAYSAALDTDEISLVGLAARVQDAVVLTAVRESVVLYAEVSLGAVLHLPPPQYVWKVDEELAQYAKRFIDTFNALFGETLPPPVPAQAERYWQEYQYNLILGRCVRLGYDDSSSPVRHYHWAICRTPDGALAVQEFWKSEVWTTTRYRTALRGSGRCPDL